MGGYAAYGPHQALFSYKAIGFTDNIEGSGIENGGSDLEIDKRGMVHEKEGILLLFQSIHSYFFKPKVCLFKCGP